MRSAPARGEAPRTFVPFRHDDASSRPSASFQANLGAAAGGASDQVNGSNGSVNLFSAQAGVTGSGDTIQLYASTMTQSGSSDAFVFQPKFGEDTINGFASTDTMQFSAADFANFSALQSHTSQSGSNTVITLDPSDTVTLTNVTATSLVTTQFRFV